MVIAFVRFVQSLAGETSGLVLFAVGLWCSDSLNRLRGVLLVSLWWLLLIVPASAGALIWIWVEWEIRRAKRQ